MGAKSKQGMWCDYCQVPVAGEKATRRARNTAAVVGALPTAGLSLLATKTEGYHCPNCGQPVRRATKQEVAFKAERTVLANGTAALAAEKSVVLRTEPPGTRLSSWKAGKAMGEAIRLISGGDKTTSARLMGELPGSPQTLGPFDGATATMIRDRLCQAGFEVAVVGSPGAAPDKAEDRADAVDRLKQLAELHASGALTDDEFDAMKAQIIQRGS